MKKNINAVNVEEHASSILRTMERDLTKVQEVFDLDLNDLIEIIDRQSDDDKDKIVSTIINRQLENLKSMTMEQFDSIKRDVDEITDYYASKKEEFDVVIEEGDYIANQILFKVIGYNGRKLELPIDISMIKKYCFSTELKEEQFYDAFMWIALRYIAISRCISWQKFEEDYKKNKELCSK